MMTLGKVFQLGGLFKGPSRQAEPAGGFRRLLNVWQDRNAKYRPMGEQTAFFTPDSPYADTTVLRTGFIRRFKKTLFSCYLGNYDFGTNPYDPASSANFFNVMDKDGNDITPVYNTSGTLGPDVGDWTFGRDSYPNTVVGDKLFFKAGVLPLLKYDGVQVLRAGLPVPYLECAEYNTTPTRWVRAISARLGFDGTMVASGYLQFPVNANTVNIETTYAHIATELVGQAKVTPLSRYSPRLEEDYLDDVAYIVRNTGVNWVYDGGLQTMTCTASAHNLQVGQWVMWSEVDENWLNTDSYMFAMKVTNVAGLVITFDANGKKYSKNNLTWIDAVISTAIYPFSNIPPSYTTYGTSQHILIYSTTGTDASAAYTFNLPIPVVGIHDATSRSYAVNLNTSWLASGSTHAPFAGQVTADLSGWYDVGTVKIQYPYEAIDANTPGIIGLTKYQGLLLSYDRKAIYFSDTSAGGSDEMTSGFSSFVPLGTEYGDIVCVEGCEDFVFISRERKNFVLVGDISTGNFTISECDAETASAFSSNSALAVRGGVAFTSRQGIFFVSASGTITDVGAEVGRLFGTTREFDTDPDGVVFQPYLMTEVDPAGSSLSDPGWDGNIIKMKYDSDRNIMGILYGKKKDLGAADAEDRYAILGMSLTTGKFFEWKVDQVASKDVVVTDFDFIASYGSDGKFTGSLVQSGVTTTKEDNTEPFTSARYLITSWLVGDQPSLEKQAQQIKFYGQMESCQIFHQENWEAFTTVAAIVAPRTNVTYPTANNTSTNEFEHKQRLNTSRAQAISVGFAPLDDNFSLEGYEIEWDLIQGAMKK